MLVNLIKRSNEAELMDDPNVDEKDLAIALYDISRVNRLLGGNSITINSVLEKIKANENKREWIIADLGCGDGEMLRQLADVLRKKGVKAKLIGIDNNKKCLSQANNLSKSYTEIIYKNIDILTLTKEDFSCDIILCTLTLHHFKDDEIKEVLQKSLELVSSALIINDIHRNTWSYYLFKVFSYFFIKGRIAKNDGLVSIKRGFKRKELVSFAEDLGLKKYQLHWKWAFRYRWIINN
ncbi:2-polyprenyl-3-methyl-5-hydroxy-6-metoxy-1,4-benzoquinol methylase [Aquimarina amphilecti]|uniref:2-polyprenyl-3-methyl-5-hydroxy-6-metoxy-1,4-benzoquinol methylase n=1 Tax=Aquimarina amphilecti TaxID=1038014 RepID=A0A1H7H4W9_AQUAM|nr:methyltransferase domain-containing protein [Aquimarina amphilecti]SEK44342.1 2-polyprenyl-3-methyl-5-hydroxy-6-metoxy-1,4-benzoquinol methylase [Aquimarina amphilecti]